MNGPLHALASSSSSWRLFSLQSSFLHLPVDSTQLNDPCSRHFNIISSKTHYWWLNKRRRRKFSSTQINKRAKSGKKFQRVLKINKKWRINTSLAFKLPKIQQKYISFAFHQLKWMCGVFPGRTQRATSRAELSVESNEHSDEILSCRLENIVIMINVSFSARHQHTEKKVSHHHPIYRCRVVIVNIFTNRLLLASDHCHEETHWMPRCQSLVC